MENLLKDVRYAFRGLARAPGFTLAAAASLALGIGGATAMFGAVDAVVLRPLPYADPGRLVMLSEANYEKALPHEPLSPVNFLDYRSLGAFAGAAAWWRPQLNLSDDAGEPVRVSAVETSANLFSVLGVAPRIGRGFSGGPLHGPEHEVAISHRLWRGRFRERPDVVGRAIRLDGRPYAVVGVMPPGFRFPDDTDVWVRLSWDLSQHSRAAHFMGSVARLAPGASLTQAQSELDALAGRLGRESPRTNSGWGVRAVALHDEVVGFFRPAFLTLLAAVGLLLVIACLNVANLLLARAAARDREVTVRAALGASRARLLRQLLTESAVLASLSAALGLGLARAGVLALRAAPFDIPRVDQVGLDARVLAFACGLTLVTTLAFGAAPALALSRPDLQRALKERGASGDGRGRLRGALVAAQVGIALMLLAGASLLVRSFERLASQDAGFRAHGAITADVQLPRAVYREWADVSRFYSELLSSLRAHPAVADAGAANFLPLVPGWRMPFRIAGRPPLSAEEQPTAQHHTVDEGYFRTLGVPFLRGRAFDERDTADTSGVVIVNETAARRYWPGEDPVGTTVVTTARNIGPLGRNVVEAPERLVVGVVADVRNNSLQSGPEPALYFPQRQFPFANMHVVVRGKGDPGALAAVVRDATRRLDPGLPLGEVQGLPRVLAAAMERPRFLMALMTAFAAAALLLAGLGVYGVLSYAVSRRSREISVRMALGAPPAAIVWMVARHGLALTLAGALAGAFGAFALGRALSGLLFGVGPGDPRALAAAVGLLLVVALIASVLPARRASALDPLDVLRGE